MARLENDLCHQQWQGLLMRGTQSSTSDLTALARACSMHTYRGRSFEGNCLRNSFSALTVAKAWTSCPF